MRLEEAKRPPRLASGSGQTPGTLGAGPKAGTSLCRGWGWGQVETAPQERSFSQLPMAGVTSFWALPLT